MLQKFGYVEVKYKWWVCHVCENIRLLDFKFQGPLKLEGIYRRACEVTLRVMRNEIDPLMR